MRKYYKWSIIIKTNNRNYIHRAKSLEDAKEKVSKEINLLSSSDIYIIQWYSTPDSTCSRVYAIWDNQLKNWTDTKNTGATLWGELFHNKVEL